MGNHKSFETVPAIREEVQKVRIPMTGFGGNFMRDNLLTNRLILRDIVESDADLLFELDSDPEVMRYIGPRPAQDVGSYLDRLRTVYQPWQSHPWHGVRIVLDRVTREFFGWIFMRPATASNSAKELGWIRSDEIEVGYRFHRSVWGRGVATEAASLLVQIALVDPATYGIVGCALASNKGSLRVLEKLGLTRVGEVILPGGKELTVKLARFR